MWCECGAINRCTYLLKTIWIKFRLLTSWINISLYHTRKLLFHSICLSLVGWYPIVLTLWCLETLHVRYIANSKQVTNFWIDIQEWKIVYMVRSPKIRFPSLTAALKLLPMYHFSTIFPLRWQTSLYWKKGRLNITEALKKTKELLTVTGDY